MRLLAVCLWGLTPVACQVCACLCACAGLILFCCWCPDCSPFISSAHSSAVRATGIHVSKVVSRPRASGEGFAVPLTSRVAPDLGSLLVRWPVQRQHQLLVCLS